jgi:hypothetical protein
MISMIFKSLFSQRPRTDSPIGRIGPMTIFHPRLVDVAPFAAGAAIIAVLALALNLDARGAAWCAVGFLTAGIAISMGADVKKHGLWAVGFVVWLSAVVVLVVRLTSGGA